MAANASEAEEGEGKRARIVERSERWPTGEAAMTEVGGAHKHGAGEGLGVQICCAAGWGRRLMSQTGADDGGWWRERNR
jgi:hypothetical protein